MAKRKLTKSNNAVFAGVLGGIAEYFGWDPSVVRILFVVVSIFSTGFPGIIVYLVLMLIMPDASNARVTAAQPKARKNRKDVTNSSKSDDDNWSDY